MIATLVGIGDELKRRGYRFTTVTPETHRRVLDRPWDPQSVAEPGQALRHFFGWNRLLHPTLIPEKILSLLEKDGLLDKDASGAVRSRVRYATLDENIYAHSAYPTDQESAVFFGPDSYRFVHFLKRQKFSPEKILDIGCGSGVGALSMCRQNVVKILCDINKEALRFAQANARLNGCEAVEFHEADILNGAPAGADLLIANPPFIIDAKNRKYRDGGSDFGSGVSLKIVRQSLDYLKPGARLAMYTGSALVEGVDLFRQQVESLLKGRPFELSYEELDPDIFGEEMSTESYRQVERISAVGLVISRHQN